MTETSNKEKRDGLLYLLKLGVELAIVIGLPQIGGYMAEPWGEFGKAAASDVGWLLGLFAGVLTIYLVESATIGLRWPNPKTADDKPSWLLVLMVTCVAAGGIAGLLLYGRVGGWIAGGLVAVCLLSISITFNRFGRTKAQATKR